MSALVPTAEHWRAQHRRTLYEKEGATVSDCSAGDQHQDRLGRLSAAAVEETNVMAWLIGHGALNLPTEGEAVSSFADALTASRHPNAAGRVLDAATLAGCAVLLDRVEAYGPAVFSALQYAETHPMPPQRWDRYLRQEILGTWAMALVDPAGVGSRRRALGLMPRLLDQQRKYESVVVGGPRAASNGRDLVVLYSLGDALHRLAWGTGDTSSAVMVLSTMVGRADAALTRAALWVLVGARHLGLWQ
jgi:hypothetical protein